MSPIERDEKGFYLIPNLGKMVSVTTALSVIEKAYLRAWYGREGTKKAIFVLKKLEYLSPKACDLLTEYLGDKFYKDAKQLMEEKAAVGTETHKQIEQYLKGESVCTKDLSREVANCFGNFFIWFSTLPEPQIIQTEHTVFSKKYGYAGTADAIIKVGRKLYLCDWKTGVLQKKFNDTQALQAVAYKYAAKEMNPCYKTCDLMVIRFAREGGFKATRDILHIPKKEHAKIFRAFLHTFETWKFVHGWKYVKN